MDIKNISHNINKNVMNLYNLTKLLIVHDVKAY